MFLNFVNFYCWFIKNYSRIASFLIDNLKMNLFFNTK